MKHYHMKTYGERMCRSSPHDEMEVSGQRHAPAALPPGKDVSLLIAEERDGLWSSLDA
jgi:hypothetical protein